MINVKPMSVAGSIEPPPPEEGALLPVPVEEEFVPEPDPELPLEAAAATVV